MALLLTAAAILAALIGGRASALSASASTLWHEATRDKVKEAAAYVEQIRYVYGVEVPRALSLTQVRLRIEELDQILRQENVTPATRSSLEYEREVQEEVLDQTLSASALASNPAYRTPVGFDPLLMLSDERANQPEFLELDPDTKNEEGTRTGNQAIQMMMSTIPVAAAFFCGSLARTFARRRRFFLAAGVIFLVAGAVAAIVTEVA